MQSPTGQSTRSRWIWALPGLGLIAAAILIAAHLHEQHLADRLLSVLPDDAAADPTLLRYAVAQARPLYRTHCAACHGATMQGNPATGAPDLTDHSWLYGDGSTYEIERTLLYGIRSGHSQARNITDMPGFGLRGRLTPGQIHSLVQYLLKLSGRVYEAGAAADGRALYADPAINCGDCHGADGEGNPDYGAPDLTVNTWNNGADPQSLYDSVYFGRHRIMPAWLGTLSLAQIRALAVYVYVASHPAAAPAAGNGTWPTAALAASGPGAFR